jgi:hypothetical protein
MINQLSDFIHKTFPRLPARDLICLAQMVVALIRERTVNLKKLSLHCSYESKKPEARYRRLQRFLGRTCITQSQWASLVMSFLKSPVLLALDRTNWAFGKFQINILVLSVVYQNSAVPVFWSFLPHKGASSPQDRITLIDAFLNLFGRQQIQALVMDREFIGPEWLNHLVSQEITFHVRLRNNIKISRGKGELRSPAYDFQDIKPLEVWHLPGLRKLGSKKDRLHLFVSLTRSKEGELVIITSNKEQELSLERYAQRWSIETLFGCLKTRGFCMEETHLSNPDKISNLLMILSFSFFWALRMGTWIHTVVPIKLKKHGRRAISLFRSGLDALVLASHKAFHWLLIPLSPSSKPPPKPCLSFLGLD